MTGKPIYANDTERLHAGLPDRPIDGCWPWTRARTRTGYGKVGRDGRTIEAHRLAYLTWVGPIPDGLFVLHCCDTPLCCRPDHLYVGTQKQNIADMMARGRNVPPRGERSGKTHLTDEDVRAIRADSRSLRMTGADYGISGAQVSRIRLRQQWAHVE